jgi:hypothetical protein
VLAAASGKGWLYQLTSVHVALDPSIQGTTAPDVRPFLAALQGDDSTAHQTLSLFCDGNTVAATMVLDREREQEPEMAELEAAEGASHSHPLSPAPPTRTPGCADGAAEAPRAPRAAPLPSLRAVLRRHVVLRAPLRVVAGALSERLPDALRGTGIIVPGAVACEMARRMDVPPSGHDVVHALCHVLDRLNAKANAEGSQQVLARAEADGSLTLTSLR